MVRIISGRHRVDRWGVLQRRCERSGYRRSSPRTARVDRAAHVDHFADAWGAQHKSYYQSTAQVMRHAWMPGGGSGDAHGDGCQSGVSSYATAPRTVDPKDVARAACGGEATMGAGVISKHTQMTFGRA